MKGSLRLGSLRLDADTAEPCYDTKTTLGKYDDGTVTTMYCESKTALQQSSSRRSELRLLAAAASTSSAPVSNASCASLGIQYKATCFVSAALTKSVFVR